MSLIFHRKRTGICSKRFWIKIPFALLQSSISQRARVSGRQSLAQGGASAASGTLGNASPLINKPALAGDRQ